MSNVLLSSRAGRGGIGTRRNHNYQAMYGPEPKGQEAGENARVWSVYLDEADDYDSDMINSFRTILDSLLVFASLFSAVVTTFAAQTSQVFQPNSAQISALLLIENNQLLRAAGNTTRIGSVPTSSLSPHGTTYTSIDLWVNGLFFVSLTLSLTTALLTVLAKQWIQTYVGVVPGNAKTQARVRQFRFDGLVKWKLGTIIESLPLILHSAVAAFLVGLALYVSQISGHICTIISLITALTFLFYLATSIIPTFSIDCPYRISSIFSLVQFLILIASSVRTAILVSQCYCQGRCELDETINPSPPTENTTALWKCLSWLFAHSTDNITKEIVVEGVSGMLHDLESSVLGNQVLHRPVVASLLLDVLVHSVNCQSELEESSDCDNPVDSTWNGAITAILSKPPDCLPLTLPRDLSSLEWRNFEIGVWKLYTTAFRENNQPYVESCVCLMKRFGMGQTIGGYLSKNGNDDDMRFAMDKRIKDLFFPPETTPFDSNMETSYPLGILLGRSHHQIEHNGPGTRRDDHWAANVYQSEPLPNTVMYLPLTPNTNKETSVEVEFGVESPPYTKLKTSASSALHVTAIHGSLDGVKYLLDRGWDRTARNDLGETPSDVARTPEIMQFLKEYQTVPFPRTNMLRLVTPTRQTGHLPRTSIPPPSLPAPDDKMSVKVEAGLECALHGSIDGVKYLLDRGWDRTGTNDLGETPIDIARTAKVIRYLEEYQTVPLPRTNMLPPPTPTHSEKSSGIPNGSRMLPLPPPARRLH